MFAKFDIGLILLMLVLVLLGLVTLKLRILWWLFKGTPFPWNDFFVGAGSLFVVLVIISLVGC